MSLVSEKTFDNPLLLTLMSHFVSRSEFTKAFVTFCFCGGTPNPLGLVPGSSGEPNPLGLAPCWLECPKPWCWVPKSDWFSANEEVSWLPVPAGMEILLLYIMPWKPAGLPCLEVKTEHTVYQKTKWATTQKIVAGALWPGKTPTGLLSYR